MGTAKKTQKKITIRLVKGMRGHPENQRDTVRGLGLRRRMQERTLENTSAVRGMIKKVIHLLEIVSET
jgi:large subunit ribosomal protein L30